jgi:hypothetical protein
MVLRGSNLVQYTTVGKGLRQLTNGTIEVLPDGTTLTFNASNQLYIPNSAISTNQIADNSITTSKIQNSQITKAKMTDTGRAIVDIRYYENISATSSSYNTPFLLTGWKLLRVNVVTRGWASSTGNYWTIEIHLLDTSLNDTYLGTIMCSPPSVNPYWAPTVIGEFTADKDYVIYTKFVKTGSPPNFIGYAEFVICPTDTVYRY